MKKILKHFKLLCSSLNYSALLSVYFTAKLIIAYTTDENYDATFSSVPLQKALYSYRDVISSSLIDEHTDLWICLCKELQHTGLDQDYLSFFRLLMPFAVNDWDTFSKHFMVSDVGKMLVALCLILRDSPMDAPDISNNCLQDCFKSGQHIFRKVGLDFDSYMQCWRAVHLTDLANSEHTPSVAIARAVRLYHNMQLPMKDLLSDYAALYLQEDVLAQRKAMTGNRKRNRTTPEIECGRSEKDFELERTLRSLALESPTDVVRGLFYQPKRNDAGFECTYLLQYFYVSSVPNERVLIVNPSPDMILSLTKGSYSYKKYTFLVLDRTLVDLYTKQFGLNHKFLTAEMLENCDCRYDHILITTRDHSLDSLLVCLKCFSSNAHITALIPETSLSMMYEQLECTGIHIHTVLSVPTKATQSAPRKKVLIDARTDWTENGCLIHRGICDESQTLFKIDKCFFWAPYTWLTSKMTIADMRKAAQIQHIAHCSHEPKIVRYSPEIHFRLTTQEDRRGAVAGRIYYRKILRPEDHHRKRGDRVTPIIEKGLRKKTEADVIKAVEYVALDERIVPSVVVDIVDFYSDKLHELSLKTAWYCLRPILLTKYGYNDETVQEMLSNKDNTLSLIPIGTSNPMDYDDAMSNIIPDDIPPMRFWKQLHLIIQTAKTEGYIPFDSLEGYMTIVEKRLTKRQQEVRNALVKKTLDRDEEIQLVRQFIQHGQPKKDWMESDPLALALPLTMLAVPVLREATALRWADMVPNADLGTWHLRVTNYLGDDGTLHPLIHRSIERYRCIPVAPILARMLLDYKAYLAETYVIEEAELAAYPILMHNYAPLQKKNTELCPDILRYATTKIHEYISLLQIPANEVIIPDGTSEHITDLNRFVGNILYTNLKYHLRHICGFWEGELCYFLGRKAPDTFSAHYCAYDHPLLLHRMAIKMERWTKTITDAFTRSHQPTYRTLEVRESTDLVFSGAGPYCDLVILPDEHCTGTITLEIESRYGYSGKIVTICKEGAEIVE